MHKNLFCFDMYQIVVVKSIKSMKNGTQLWVRYNSEYFSDKQCRCPECRIKKHKDKVYAKKSETAQNVNKDKQQKREKMLNKLQAARNAKGG